MTAFVVDAIFLGGAALASVRSMWKPYQTRVLVHEAGHILAGEILAFINN